MQFKRIAALVPMRHHSQRVPGKNFRDLAGKPLYQHILETLLSCAEIDVVVVDTDSPVIQEGIASKYPQVQVLVRPESLRADDVPMNEILVYDTSQVRADLYLQTHSTNPLVTPGTISKAIQRFDAQYPAYDSLFAVTRIRSRLWDALTRPINHNPAILLQTQDLPPIYEENSCFYIFTSNILLERRNRIGERPMMVEIPRSEAQDIDEEEDFLVADLLMRYRQNSGLI